jgi:oligopeptide transport system substrate-binding protein
VPRQLVEKYGEDWSEHLAGNEGFGGNLYKLTRLDDEGHITLTRNETFWDAKPKLRAIEYQLYDSAQAAWVGYLRGAGDVVYPPADLPTDAPRNPDFHQVPQLGVYYFRPNWKKPRSTIYVFARPSRSRLIAMRLWRAPTKAQNSRRTT